MTLTCAPSTRDGIGSGGESGGGHGEDHDQGQQEAGDFLLCGLFLLLLHFLVTLPDR